jgi:hypothetical protein
MGLKMGKKAYQFSSLLFEVIKQDFKPHNNQSSPVALI